MGAKTMSAGNGDSFLDYYLDVIAPALRRIDVALKTEDFPIRVSLAARLLGVSNDEVFTVLGGLRKEAVDREAFFVLLRQGTGEICGLLRRELMRGSPALYRPDDVTYIYGLDAGLVIAAFAELDIAETTEAGLPDIFVIIPAKR